MEKIKEIFKNDLMTEKKVVRFFISTLFGIIVALLLIWLFLYFNKNGKLSHSTTVISGFALCFVLRMFAGLQNYVICIQDFGFAVSMSIILGVATSFWYGFGGVLIGMGVFFVDIFSVLFGTYVTTLD